MTTALILNLVLSALVLIPLLAHIVRAIATQHHDRGVTLVSGQPRYRWVRTRPERPHAPQPRRARGYRGQVWPVS
jgi:hypothetical protein